MKTTLYSILSWLALAASTNMAAAQGTAFTYQGRLDHASGPTTGIYDWRFELYDAATNGNLAGGPLTNSAVGVTNGLFTVTLDFGAGVFDGAPRFLEIGVRTNGGGAFSTLAPRQALTPAPYAAFANVANNVSGTILNSSLPASPTFSGTVAANSFSGNGGGITNLNASQFSTGILPLARLPGAVLTNNAAGIILTGTFTGFGAGVSNVNLVNVDVHGLVAWAANTGAFVLASSPSVGALPPKSVAAADVNGDGKVDLIAVIGSSTLIVLTNGDNGAFEISSSPDAAFGASSVIAVDVNGDGKVDLICPNNTIPGRLEVLLNNGSGGFALSSAPIVGSYPISVATADVNEDGKVDLICANSGDNTLSVLTNNGSGNFTLSATLSVGLRPVSVVAADVTGDGKVDLICANANTDTLTVLTNNGSGAFGIASSPSSGDYPASIVAADVNGDGALDIVCASGFGTVTILTNSGSGSFTVSSSPAVGYSPEYVVAADVNGDGKPDVICGRSMASTLTVLTNNGSGGFAFSSSPIVGNSPYAVAAADVNGDGMVDLISANYGDNTLSVLLNTAPISARLAGDGSGLTNLSLNAASFSGTLSASVIPNLDASKITTGTLNTSVIPNLDASKITSGTLSLARLSGITAAQLNAATWQLATNLNGGNAALATNVVAGISITNAFITNSILAGNGGALTNLNASLLNGQPASAFAVLANPVFSGVFSGTVTTPALVASNAQITGLLRSGSETGTTQAPVPAGLVIRRINSLTPTLSNVVARTDVLTLERDGSNEGLLIRYPAGGNRQTIRCLAQSLSGTNIIFHTTVNNPASAGTIQLLTSAQHAVHADISFGNSFNSGQMTQVVLDRYDDGITSDYFWVGTVTSTYNQ